MPLCFGPAGAPEAGEVGGDGDFRCGAGKDKGEDKKDFFFEKKKQKTFLIWASGGFKATVTVNKNFLLLFYKKEALPLSS
ncbi:hypothetical protein [Acidiphilium acidophilum]|uniref:hypothetical protein n=1 Tax=Acidiphilium acidophilum TaxID=76588 RepID=UPI002E8E76C7|nr:hypothetical protein [Acidiphilium acidophilum]